jgi:hypothetical protein
VAGVEEMPGASASVVSRRGGEVGCRWSGGGGMASVEWRGSGWGGEGKEGLCGGRRGRGRI